MIRLGRLIFLVTFFALIVQGVFLFYDQADELMMFPYVLVLGGAAAFFLGRNTSDPDSDFQVNIFLIAFSIRLWMGMLLYGWGLTAIFGDDDASGFGGGWVFAENWYANGFDGFISDLSLVFFEEQNLGHKFLWGIPMFVAGGPSRMLISATSSFAGSMLVIVLFRIARRVFGSETARTTAVLATFWASMILLSAGTGKEMLVICLEWTVLYLLIRNPKGLRLNDGLAAIPAFLAVFIMRFYAVYLLAAAAMFRFIVASRQNLVRNAVFGTVLVASLMIFLGAGGAITRDFARIERLNTVVDHWRENVAEQTGSGVDIYGEYESTTVALPVATVYFFFAPFPWEAFSGSARNAFGAVENIFIIAMVVLGFPALRIFFREKFVDLAPIFAFCALYAGMHIWGLSNVGLAWRHKQTVMPLIFMLVAVAIAHRRAGWQRIRSRFNNREKEKLTVIRAG
jgi:hypothetical protein